MKSISSGAKAKKINITIKHRILHEITKQCKRISFSNTSELCFDLDLLGMIRKRKLTPCCMLLRFVGSCCTKFETGQTFEPTTQKFLLFLGRQSVAQQCWIRLHSSSNIVRASNAH